MVGFPPAEGNIMEYVYWTIAVLVGMYVLVRLVFWQLFKKERYKG
jgi:hypothetical protein